MAASGRKAALTALYEEQVHVVAFLGQVERLSEILSRHPELVSVRFDFAAFKLLSQKEASLKSSGKWGPPPLSDAPNTMNLVREGIRKFLTTSDLNTCSLEQRWCLQEYWSESTLLHYAALGDAKDCVKLLLKLGASSTACNKAHIAAGQCATVSRVRELLLKSALEAQEREKTASASGTAAAAAASSSSSAADASGAQKSSSAQVVNFAEAPKKRWSTAGASGSIEAAPRPILKKPSMSPAAAAANAAAAASAAAVYASAAAEYGTSPSFNHSGTGSGTGTGGLVLGSGAKGVRQRFGSAYLQQLSSISLHFQDNPVEGGLTAVRLAHSKNRPATALHYVSDAAGAGAGAGAGGAGAGAGAGGDLDDDPPPPPDDEDDAGAANMTGTGASGGGGAVSGKPKRTSALNRNQCFRCGVKRNNQYTTTFNAKKGFGDQFDQRDQFLWELPPELGGVFVCLREQHCKQRRRARERREQPRRRDDQSELEAAAAAAAASAAGMGTHTHMHMHMPLSSPSSSASGIGTAPTSPAAAAAAAAAGGIVVSVRGHLGTGPGPRSSLLVPSSRPFSPVPPRPPSPTLPLSSLVQQSTGVGWARNSGASAPPAPPAPTPAAPAALAHSEPAAAQQTSRPSSPAPAPAPAPSPHRGDETPSASATADASASAAASAPAPEADGSSDTDSDGGGEAWETKEKTGVPIGEAGSSLLPSGSGTRDLLESSRKAQKAAEEQRAQQSEHDRDEERREQQKHKSLRRFAKSLRPLSHVPVEQLEREIERMKAETLAAKGGKERLLLNRLEGVLVGLLAGKGPRGPLEHGKQEALRRLQRDIQVRHAQLDRAAERATSQIQRQQHYQQLQDEGSASADGSGVGAGAGPGAGGSGIGVSILTNAEAVWRRAARNIHSQGDAADDPSLLRLREDAAAEGAQMLLDAYSDYANRDSWEGLSGSSGGGPSQNQNQNQNHNHNHNHNQQPGGASRFSIITADTSMLDGLLTGDSDSHMLELYTGKLWGLTGQRPVVEDKVRSPVKSKAVAAAEAAAAAGVGSASAPSLDKRRPFHGGGIGRLY